MKRIVLLLCLLLAPLFSFSQLKLKGVVRDEDHPVFAANVYIKSNLQNAAVTGFDGSFELLVQAKDTLVISHINYHTKQIPLATISLDSPLNISLSAKTKALEEVVIQYTDPISEQFSVVKMEMLADVYLNPIAQGDPLKAITIQAFSTNTDESANPSLRGSNADRTRVVYNGVPIINPVRSANLSNQGFFSLLNADLIGKQYVYASNPTLTYGNSSAGLVEVETKRKLINDDLQISMGLASLGFLVNQKIKNKSFIQVYGNYQFSEGFTGIQANNLPTLKRFRTKDLGINFHSQLNERIEINSFAYFIQEGFDGKNIERYTYAGDVESGKQRFLTINNFTLYTKNGSWQINNGISVDHSNYEYGNANYDTKYKNIYTSINYKCFVLDQTNIQFGVSYDHHNHIFKDSIPSYYYANSSTSPNHYREENIKNNIAEAYAYMLWKLNKKWSFSSAVRSNMPVDNQGHYLSSQMSFKFRPSVKHHFLLSRGDYNSYSVPNSLSVDYRRLKSSQLALDYTFDNKKTVVKAGAYYKNESSQMNSNDVSIPNQVKTYGIDIFATQRFLKYFKATFANAYINQTQIIGQASYVGDYDLNYFVKANLEYVSPTFLTIALGFIGRPGHHYTPVSSSSFNPEIDFYEPTFDEDLFSQQYDNYSSFNINLSKYIIFGKKSIVIYATMNNVLNRKNQQSIQYNKDYSISHFNHYSLRTVYFGMVCRL